MGMGTASADARTANSWRKSTRASFSQSTRPPSIPSLRRSSVAWLARELLRPPRNLSGTFGHLPTILSTGLTSQSHHQQSGVKCSIKANEGHLFCLEKSFMFVPKPATYIPFDNIAVIAMSRVGGAVSASRTFDITITMKSGGTEHQFSNINRYANLKHVQGQC